MAGYAEDPFASVGVFDCEKHIPVGPLPWVTDEVNIWSGGLKIGELPTQKLPNLVGAASGRHAIWEKCLPCPAALGMAGCATACGRDEASRTRELDLVISVERREGHPSRTTH